MAKKISAFFLAILMIVPIAVACAETNDGTTDTTAALEATVAPSGTEAVTEPA